MTSDTRRGNTQKIIRLANSQNSVALVKPMTADGGHHMRQWRRGILATLAGLGLTIGCHQPDEDFGCGHETVVEVQDYELAVAGRWQIPAQVMEAGSTSRVPITSAGAWQGQSSCSGTFTEGARRVQAYISARWPEVISIGGYLPVY